MHRLSWPDSEAQVFWGRHQNSCFFGISFPRKAWALQVQCNITSLWSFTTVSQCLCLGWKGNPAKVSVGRQHLAVLWSLAPVTWEQSPAQAGDIVSGKSQWVCSNEAGSSASKAAVAGMGGIGRGCFWLLLELFMELEENVQGLEVCQKAYRLLSTLYSCRLPNAGSAVDWSPQLAAVASAGIHKVGEALVWGAWRSFAELLQILPFQWRRGREGQR